MGRLARRFLSLFNRLHGLPSSQEGEVFFFFFFFFFKGRGLPMI
jgi:hypothetical protein